MRSSWLPGTTCCWGRVTTTTPFTATFLRPAWLTKWAPNYRNVLRLRCGYRLQVGVHLHGRSCGPERGPHRGGYSRSRKPERSWNANLNYTKKIPFNNAFLNLDATAFCTYFTNRIMPDYSKQDTILYDNLRGHSISKGISLNADVMFAFPLKVMAGVTLMDVYQKEGGGRNPARC